jgi:DNA-binding IclR family transcriptional regulator
MAARVPALERGIEVLLFLAAHPNEAQRGSTVAQTLGLSPATCHSILSCLAEAGMVTRDSAKTYSLGPVLAALGSAAQSCQEGLFEAREEIRTLAQRLGVPFSITVAVNDEMVTVDRALPPGPWEPRTVPSRVPLVPPAGLVYTSWLDPAEFEAWLRRHGRTDPTEIERYRQAAAVVRERGYAGGLETSQEQLATLLERLSDGSAEKERMVLARELVEVLRHGVDFISAPIFSSDGLVRLALAVLLPSESFVGDGFAELARELLAAASRVTVAIKGKAPCQSVGGPAGHQ